MDFFYLDRDIIFIFYLDGDASFFSIQTGTSEVYLFRWGQQG